ncbi:MAG: amidase [Bradyrhizobium sp.]|jgi:Asp-tRNA(Asn)/Glu-tRNA(Gln) amidotransferase A subunit family amidase|nr:amidase [Bradyrhizobium sp.]
MSNSPSPSLISYQAATEAFRTGKDTPREFLERSIERLDALEPTLHAFAALSLARARIAADAATARWRDGRPLSRIDGMPVGIKDVIETFDMPTGMGSPTHDGYRPMRDAATVYALRDAGAAVLGKTKTTEFAGGYATDTRNPHDPQRTAGGSSAGSASAVGAGILPVALGTQVIGSVLRPAGFCGAFGYKPTFGAINRGGSHDFQSHSCIGVIGASLADIWCTTYDMVQRSGGDPGEPGLFGAQQLAEPLKPKRLIHLETPGWQLATAEARQLLEIRLAALSAAGVEIISRHNNQAVDALETSLRDILQFGYDIIGYESRWPLKSVAYRDRMGLSPGVLDQITKSDTLGLDGYRALLTRRAALRAEFEQLATTADAFVTLNALGAAPKGITYTGNASFNVAASVLGTPALALPVLFDDGMPLGLQLISGQHTDEKLFAIAGWILAHA